MKKASDIIIHVPRRRENDMRLDYLNLRKENHNNDGSYSASKHNRNIRKYREMNEEEDINDDLDFNYRIFVKMSPFDASVQLQYNKLSRLMENALENCEKQETKEEDLENDSHQFDDSYQLHILIIML